MLAFGTIPPLLLIYGYLIITEFLPTETNETLRYYEVIIIPVLIGLAAVLTFLGFKKSGFETSITISEDGLQLDKKPKMKLLPQTKRFFKWDEITGYDTVNDGNGNVLSIHLKNHKKVIVGQSNLFETEENFARFYDTFVYYASHARLGTEGNPIEAKGNFYSRPWARVLAVVLVLAVFSFITIAKLFGEPMPYFLLRVCFLLIPTLYFFYRAFVVRK